MAPGNRPHDRRVELLLLGAMELRVDGMPVAVTAAQQRVVLAALALAAGQPVTTEALCDVLWPERVPATARTSVHNTIRRLRTLLTDAGAGDVLHTGPAGYRLELPPEAVDTRRLDALVATGRELVTAGDDAAALAAYAECWGLWRGEPLADLVNGGWLAGPAELLAEQRIAVAEEWADLARRQGHADRAVSRLQPLVEAHPLRESLRARLMLSLHDAGRTSEALEEYARARELLVEELGAEPGSTLREAHATVLRFEDLQAEEPWTPPAVPPAQLPAAGPPLVGRDRSLAELGRGLDRLAAAPVTWVVSGPAGVGKSALAVQWARAVSDRFPDGQLFVSLRGFDPAGAPLSTTEALRSLLAGLGVPGEQMPHELDALTGLYRSLLAGRRTLVLLDNARDAAQVAPLLPTAPGCLAVVTSRNELSALVVTHGVLTLTVGLLEDDEARALIAGRLDGNRLEEEPAALAEIVARCAGLPLALAVSAALVAARASSPLADLAEELRESSLDALTLGQPATDIRSVLSWSYDALSADAARAYALLGLHPGPRVSVPSLASMLGVTLRATRVAVAELARAHLVTTPRSGRIGVHDLVTAHAREVAERELGHEERECVRRRLADHYLHSAIVATRAMFVTPLPFTWGEPLPGVVPESFGGLDDALAWLTAEQATLVGVAGLAAETPGLEDHAWQLARALNGFLWDQGQFHDMVTLHQAGLRAVRRSGSKAAEADARHGLAEGYIGLEDFTRSHEQLDRALALFREIGDRVGEGDAHSTLGRMFESAGRYDESIDQTQRALAIAREIGDRSGEAVALNNIGWVSGFVKDYAATLDYCGRALEIYRELHDAAGQSYVLDSLARAYEGLGDARRAISMYAQAAELARVNGHRFNQAIDLTHLGDAQHAVGEVDAARAAWTDALELLAVVGHPRAEALRSRLALRQASAPR